MILTKLKQLNEFITKYWFIPIVSLVLVFIPYLTDAVIEKRKSIKNQTCLSEYVTVKVPLPNTKEITTKTISIKSCEDQQITILTN